MQFAIHDIIDDAAIAFDTEGVSELDIRDAIVRALHDLAMKRLGPAHELSSIFDEKTSNREIEKDLAEFNSWESPNRREEQDELGI